ncbi:MAG: PepSY domain-containing protein [Bacteriovoracaceae bacterium]|nr:PepSY domain-containing protein [Bacteriovoracaceae bacterium]
MKSLYLVLVAFSLNAFSAVQCTDEDKSKWLEEGAFKAKLTETYEIKNFKVTKGNCYEIYGKDKAGKKVEIYFNPVDGKIVKQK